MKKKNSSARENSSEAPGLSSSRQSQLPETRNHSKIKIPIYKTIHYYRRHGLRRTVQRIYAKLMARFTGRRTVKVYSLESYSPAISAASTIKKVSFLIGLTEGECKRYRVYNIVEGLTGKGIQCCVFYEANADKLELVADSDLVIIFRAQMSLKLDAIIKKLHLAGVPVGFDVDDLIFDPQYVDYIDAFKSLPDILKHGYLNEVKRYQQALQKCDFVTCTTEFLAGKARQPGKPSYVIPNTINKAQYDLAKVIHREHGNRDNVIRIGYFSGTSTHDRDFLEAAGALAEILKKYSNTVLHIVGPVRLTRELKQFGKRIIRKPLVPHLEMLKYLSTMDINVAPLEQGTPFNEGKSELKIFEAALVGVPTLASRTDSYSRCISDGTDGLLAGSREEWFQKLSSLIENEAQRKEMGLRAKMDIAERFYIENVIDDIIKVYEKIIAK